MSQATPLPKPNLIASLTMFPVGMGTSVSEQVGKAYQSIKGIDGINVEPNSMSTIIEANSLEKIWEAVSAAHETLLQIGSQRIYMVLTLDDRRDEPHTAEHKVARMLGND